MKIYDLVKELLEKYPQTRNSDKFLMWTVWTYQIEKEEGKKPLENGLPQFLPFHMFINTCTTPESITRARRKVQEIHPELQAIPEIQAIRAEKESKKGTFIFDEEDNIEI